jgi:hypothetical protein
LQQAVGRPWKACPDNFSKVTEKVTRNIKIQFRKVNTKEAARLKDVSYGNNGKLAIGEGGEEISGYVGGVEKTPCRFDVETSKR